MGTARDIALIFLSLEALIMALIPLAFFVGLAYGVYRLRGIVKEYLHIAQQYAQKLYDAVEQASKTVTDPLIQAHAKVHMVATMARRLWRAHDLVSRRQQ